MTADIDRGFGLITSIPTASAGTTKSLAFIEDNVNSTKRKDHEATMESKNTPGGDHAALPSNDVDPTSESIGDVAHANSKDESPPVVGNASSEAPPISTSGAGDGPAPPDERADDTGDPARPGPAPVNLLEHWDEDEGDDDGEALPLVRLSEHEIPVVLFTPDTIMVKIHYCEEPEIRGYVHCNGPTCALCRAGHKPEERALLPVYLPTARRVGVLPISTSSRPGALRPQIMPVLRSGKPSVLLIRKADRVTFKVGVVELKEGMDDGARTIAAFRKRWEAGTVDLASVYPRLDDQDLAAIPAIDAMLKIKGLGLDDHD